ncbi:class I SAM-dependent methyltransferase [Mariprofundus ferrooxydans]|uniref:class I SAM-dependent methyltransferase n=1 Tax=Mariprofundus ferrooxydans TaxID=314344 RepID=UPI001431B704|nr:class I SAM-dependent methyltransferase [Mariprofundus ferrooxydans]
MKIKWVKQEELLAAGEKAMLPSDVLLDIGCGIVPQRFVKSNVHICCEPYKEYVLHLQKKIAESNTEPARSWVVLNMGWSDVIDHFLEKSVDTVILVDVIEHLDKEEGARLLKATEEIARKQVIVFTPWGFMPQHHDDGIDGWGLGGGDWQEHKSGWLPEDFVGRGWEFIACKDFHQIDSNGNPLENPFGAFWAIKTLRDPEEFKFDNEDGMSEVRKLLNISIDRISSRSIADSKMISSLLLYLAGKNHASLIAIQSFTKVLDFLIKIKNALMFR